MMVPLSLIAPLDRQLLAYLRCQADEGKELVNAEELLQSLFEADTKCDGLYGPIINWDRIKDTNPKLYHLLKLEKIRLEEKNS